MRRQRQRRGRHARRLVRFEPGLGMLRPVQESPGPVQPDRRNRQRRTVVVALLSDLDVRVFEAVHADLAQADGGGPTAEIARQQLRLDVVVFPFRNKLPEQSAEGGRTVQENRSEHGGQTVENLHGQKVGEYVRHGQTPRGQIQHFAPAQEKVEGESRGDRNQR